MTLVLIAAAVAVLVVNALIAAAWWAAGRALWQRHTARPVLVELQDGRTVEGLEIRRSRQWLTLAGARTFGEAGPVAVDGHVHIPRAHVAWIITDHKGG